MAENLSDPDPLSSFTGDKIQTRFTVALFYFCQGLCFSSWASRIPDIKTSLHLSEGNLGSLLLCLPAGQLITLPFSGRLVTKYGSRNVLAFAIICYALELTNLAWASQQWQLALALVIFGVFGNLCNIAVNTQGVSVEKIYGRQIMSSFHGGWSTGGVAGSMIGLLMTNLKWAPHKHFLIIAALVIIVTSYMQQFLLKGRVSGTAKKRFFALPDKTLVKLGVIGFFGLCCEGAMFEWSGVYFKEIVKVPAVWVTVGFVTFMVMMATGRFLGDKVVLRIGRKKLLQFSGLFIATGFLTAVLLPYSISTAIGFVIIGLGVSAVVPTLYSIAGNTPNMSPSNAIATVSSIGFFGFLMGPPLIGFIAQASSLRYSFAVIAFIGLCITLMVTKLKVIK